MLIRIPERRTQVYSPMHVVDVSWSKYQKRGEWNHHRFINFFRGLLGLVKLEPTWETDSWGDYLASVYLSFSNNDGVRLDFKTDEEALACYNRIIGEVNAFYQTHGMKNPLTV